LELLHDARRFILYHKQTIETSPLQTYASALIFSPTNSLIRRLFQKEEPDWFEILPPVTDEWSLSLQTLEGHSDKVRSVAFSHDSTLLASASTDRTVKIWDASSGACRATLEGHSGSVTSVAFSHDSTLVASGSEDGTIRIWDASSGMCCAMLEGHSGMVSSVAFSHDSTLLASASHEERTKSASLTEEPPVRIWDVASRTCRTTFEGHGGYITPRPRTMTITQHGLAPRVTTFWDPVDFILPGGEGVTNAYSVPVKRVTYHVMSVAFSHDSKLLASASWEWWDRTIQIWDASSGACHATLEGHSSYVNSVTFSHDSRLLASASDDCKVKIWDASSGTCLATIEGHMKPVMSVAFSHDSTLVVSASKDFMVRTWDASSGTCCATLEGHSDSVTSVAFSQGSKLLASASEDGTIRIWDASSGVSHLTLEDHSDRLWFGLWLHAVRIWDASSDARRMTLELRGDTFLLWLGLCSWSQWSRTVRLWNAGSGGCRVPLEGCSFWLWLWLWLWWDRTVRTWLANSGPVRPTLMGRHSSSVTAVAFSHDSTLLASASDDGTIRIWGTDSGVCHAKLGGHWGSVTSVTFSRDSTLLASAGRDGTVRIWDAVHGERRATIQVHAHGYNKTVCSVSFSNNSKLLASASEDHTVRIWNVTSGACRRILKGCFPNESYAMRIDGSKVKWTPESNPEGHSGAVYSTAFSRDSSLLVSASEDRTVKIWDVSSGTCCATLAGHSDPVISVAFSHDSTLIASASHDRTVRIWDTISGECRQTVNVESLLYNISFDITGWYLHTDVGLLALDVSQASNTALDKAGRQNLQHRGAGLNSNGEWISFKSKPLVRLPSEYRPNRSTVSGSTISIGVGSGMVWVCKLQAPDIEQC
jgi:WD40 repeat protein